jgi:DNA-directed RNA polymerase specialized sigma24 family protein
MGYVTKEELSNAILDYRKTGIIGPALTTILENIVNGVVSKYGYGEDREDAKQEAWILFLRHLNKVKLEGSPFNYLTTITMNAVRHLHRQNANNTRLMYEYFNNLIDPPIADNNRHGE